MLELVRGFGLSALRVQVEREFLNELKDPQRAKTSCIMTRLLRERRVKTPGRFGRLTCLMTISVVDWVDLYLFQWYGIPNSVIDEAELIIVSDRFPIVE